jgi:hypothetical protein
VISAVECCCLIGPAPDWRSWSEVNMIEVSDNYLSGSLFSPSSKAPLEFFFVGSNNFSGLAPKLPASCADSVHCCDSLHYGQSQVTGCSSSFVNCSIVNPMCPSNCSETIVKVGIVDAPSNATWCVVLTCHGLRFDYVSAWLLLTVTEQLM